MKIKSFYLFAMFVLFVFAISNISAQTPAPTEWSVSGNTLSHGDFFCALNQQPIRFYISGSQRGIFSQYSGFLGIGTDQPAQMLHMMEGNILISKDPNANNRAPGSVNGSMLFGTEVANNTPYGRWGIE